MNNSSDDDAFWNKNKMHAEPSIFRSGKVSSMGLRVWLERIFSFTIGEDAVPYIDNIWVIGAVEILWFLVALLNASTGGEIASHGIHPRHLSGIIGVFVATLLHINFLHFLVNATGYGTLGVYIVARKNGIKLLIFLTAVSALLCGLFVWTFGRESVSHVGTSGLIHTYYGYLVISNFIKKDYYQAAGITVSFTIYLISLWGTFYSMGVLSWESHLCGISLGCFVGFLEKNIPGDDKWKVFQETQDFGVSKPIAAHSDSEDDDQIDEETFL